MPTLQWLTRDDDVRAAYAVPYRLLEEVPEMGAGDPEAGNMLIQGDNLDALKALLPFYAGQVKCIYIDPPFNTGEAFPDYDDNLEHSLWLAMMWPRLELLRELLSEEGTLVLHLDDNEIAYAIAIADEIFGRKNRRYFVTFKQSAIKGHKVINRGLVSTANYIVVYCKDTDRWNPNKVFAPRPRDKRYASFIVGFEKDMQEWKLQPLSKAFIESQGFDKLNDAKKSLGDDFDNQLDRFVMENAERVVQPVTPDYTQVGKEVQDLIDESVRTPEKIFRLDRDDALPIVLQGGKRWLFYSSKLKQIDGQYVTGEALSTIWDDLLSNNLHQEGGVKFPKGKKPEGLIKRVYELFSDVDDLVLDSFLGSGTAATVAMKMKRRFIGIEMGKQAVTHCQPRLAAVVGGENSGISKQVQWKGGSGFRFFRLGPSVFGEQGEIREDIEFDTLAAHVWFSEQGKPWTRKQRNGTVLGTKDGGSIALLFNGVLRDRSVNGGNVLTRTTLRIIRDDLPEGFNGTLLVYGERCVLSEATLKQERITFKQTPYDVKARA